MAYLVCPVATTHPVSFSGLLRRSGCTGSAQGAPVYDQGPDTGTSGFRTLERGVRAWVKYCSHSQSNLIGALFTLDGPAEGRDDDDYLHT